MKLKPSMGNVRIVDIVKDLDGVILDHEAVAVKHDIGIYNLKYLLRKMVDMGIIEIERTRDSDGKLNVTYVRVLVFPELDLKEGQETPKPKPKGAPNKKKKKKVKDDAFGSGDSSGL